MTAAKQKNLAMVIVMALFYFLYLWKHFSPIGAIVTAISIIVLFVYNYTMVNVNKYGVVNYIGRYFGVTICNFMLVLLFSMGVLPGELKYLLSEAGIIVPIAIGTGVWVWILSKFHQNSKYGGKFAYLKKYAVLVVGSVGLLYLTARMSGFTGTYWVLVYVAITALIEQIYNKHDTQDKKDCVFNWCIINIILFAFIQLAYPVQAFAINTQLQRFPIIEWEWYTILLIAIAAIGLGVYFWTVDKKSKKRAVDSKICLIIAIDLLMIPFVASVYTEYAIIIFMLLALLNVVTFFGKEEKVTVFNCSLEKSDIILGLGTLALVMLHIAFVHGWIYSAIIIFGAILSMWLVSKSPVGTEGFWFWETIVIYTAVWVAESVYRNYHAEESYVYLIFVAILTTIALFNANIKNERKYTADIAVKLTIVACSIILIMFPMKKLGVDYNIKIDNKISQSDSELAETVGETKNIVITLEARGKKNKIAKCYYYWDNDVQNHIEVPTEEKSSIEIVLSPKNGCLHMYSEDKHGVSSTKQRWFEFNELYEEPIVEDGSTESTPEGETPATPEQQQ